MLRTALLPAFLLTSVLGAQQVELRDPERARRAFVHDSALEVRPWAVEPDVVAPLALRLDAELRPHVLCGDGRLVVREGDGVRVVATFREPTDFLFHRDGVLVARAGAVEYASLGNEERVELFALRAGEVLSGLTWGLDGAVYAVRRGVDEGVVRFEPDAPDDERVLEVVARVAAPRGLARTWDGELFVTTDAAHVVHVLVEDVAFAAGRLDDAAGVRDAADHTFVQRLGSRTEPRSFGVPGGVCVLDVQGDLEGAVADLLVCEPAGGVVHQDVLSPSGLGLRARRANAAEFLASSDPGFRPSALTPGADGTLYVLDRYADRADHGRVWFVAPSGRTVPGVVPPTPASLTERELLAQLASPDRLRRETAHRLLRERGLSRPLREALLERTRSSSDPHLRVHALWLTTDGALLKSSLANYHPEVRRNALRVFRRRIDALRFGPRVTITDVETLTYDADGPTRVEAWRTWRELAGGASAARLVERLPGLEDPTTRSLALAVAARLPATFLETLFRHPEAGSLDEVVRLLAEDVVRRRDDRDAVQVVLALVGGERSSRAVATVLRTLYAGFGDRAPWVSSRVTTVLTQLARHEDPRIAAAALPLAARWLGTLLAPSELEAWSERALSTLRAPERSGELRLAAFDALLDVPEARERALASAAPQLGDRAWALLLLDALDTGRVGLEELGAARTRLLVEHADEEVARRARAVTNR